MTLNFLTSYRDTTARCYGGWTRLHEREVGLRMRMESANAKGIYNVKKIHGLGEAFTEVKRIHSTELFRSLLAGMTRGR